MSLRRILPGEDVWVAFPHIGKNVIDVVSEYGIGRNEEHLARIEALTFLVEQVSDALQQDGRLATSCDTVYQKCRNILVADYDILLLLDGCRNSLHLGSALS